jgi:hypothetical protein
MSPSHNWTVKFVQHCKFNLSPPTPWRHVRKAHSRNQSFLTLVAASAKLTSCHGRFTDGNRTPGTHSTDNCVGPGASLKFLEKIHTSCLRPEWNPGSSRLFFMAPQTLVGPEVPFVEDSRSHSDTPQSVGLPWTSDQHDAQTSTWQYTTLTRDRYLCLRRDSNPQYQQSSDCRPTPKTARPLESDHPGHSPV